MATVVWLELSNSKAVEFQAFTRAHLKQQTEVAVDGKVVAKPTILHEIQGTKFSVHFSSFSEAQAFAKSLGKK